MNKEWEYNKGFVEYAAQQLLGYAKHEIKPAEWSEEDKTNGWTGVDLERYLSCLQRLGTGNPQQPETINSKWFKEHCRPQPNWKPSEEQMETLNEAKNFAIKNLFNGPDSPISKIIESLYNDLKKL